MSGRKFVVRQITDRDGIREFSVARVSYPEFQKAVWVSSDGTPRCASCSGPLTAMLASCPHALAVKRYLRMVTK